MKKEVFKGFKKGVLMIMCFAVILTSSSVMSSNIEDKFEKVACEQCNGDEVVDCTKCNNGKVHCPGCRTFSGNRRLPDSVSCAKCDDSGEVDCSKCYGSGKIKCAGPDGCNGLGYKRVRNR